MHSLVQFSHLDLCSLCIVASQSQLFLHRSWNRVFLRIKTGEIKPMGSKTLAVRLKTCLFVGSFYSSCGSIFWKSKIIVSLEQFQDIPITLVSSGDDPKVLLTKDSSSSITFDGLILVSG